MGLDNGIMLKIKDREAFGEVPPWVEHFTWDGPDTYEINYWRKCWNVRAEVLEYLGAEDEEYEWELNPSDLIDIVNILDAALYKEDKWDDSCSIWEWSEIGEIYLEKLRYQERIAKWLQTKPANSYVIYFYDSY